MTKNEWVRIKMMRNYGGSILVQQYSYYFLTHQNPEKVHPKSLNLKSKKLKSIVKIKF